MPLLQEWLGRNAVAGGPKSLVAADARPVWVWQRYSAPQLHLSGMLSLLWHFRGTPVNSTESVCFESKLPVASVPRFSKQPDDGVEKEDVFGAVRTGRRATVEAWRIHARRLLVRGIPQRFG